MPFFSNERGVGVGMANDPPDVMLVQLLLRAILHGGKSLPGSLLKFTRPTGPVIGIIGIWDTASSNYLSEWEFRYKTARNELQKFDFLAPDYVEPVTAYPGKVVPFSTGGKKILALGRMCALMFGEDSYSSLSLPETGLPDLLAKDLFSK